MKSVIFSLNVEITLDPNEFGDFVLSLLLEYY